MPLRARARHAFITFSGDVRTKLGSKFQKVPNEILLRDNNGNKLIVSQEAPCNPAVPMRRVILYGCYSSACCNWQA